MRIKSCFAILLLLFTIQTPSARGQDELAGKKVVSESVAAAKALLDSLDDEKRKQVLFRFADETQKRNWSNLPTGIVERKGVRWGDLSAQQQQLVRKLFAATLSDEGVKQIYENMEGDEVLNTGNQRGRVIFGRDEYYLSILGTPSTTAPWMWQFGGHHLAINATLNGDQVTISPSLTGGQPIDFKLDGKMVRQVAAEEDAAYELIQSLKSKQLSDAIQGDRYVDMIWGPGKEGAQPKQVGIKVSLLESNQLEKFLKLVATRMALLKKPFAKQRMEQIKRDLDRTWFAWYGPKEKGGAASYRIQGPTILMEYHPQRLGGKPTDHIHAMYRDPTNDYGAKILKDDGK